jgi:hypothetical protein
MRKVLETDFSDKTCCVNMRVKLHYSVVSHANWYLWNSHISFHVSIFHAEIVCVKVSEPLQYFASGISDRCSHAFSNE